MNYLSAQRLKALPEGVKKKLLDYWIMQVGDLVYYQNPQKVDDSVFSIENISDYQITIKNSDYELTIAKKQVLPLFSESQLINFIEKITGFRLQITNKRLFYTEISLFSRQNNEREYTYSMSSEHVIDLLEVIIKNFE